MPHGSGQGTLQGLQNVRNEQIDETLIERVVGTSHEILNGRTAGQSVQFGFAEKVLLFAVYAVVGDGTAEAVFFLGRDLRKFRVLNMYSLS